MITTIMTGGSTVPKLTSGEPCLRTTGNSGKEEWLVAERKVACIAHLCTTALITNDNPGTTE
jgi:hypothetical protein